MATAQPVAYTPDTIEASRRREILQRHAALSSQGSHELLGVGPDASRETIKSAFQRLARRFHPDALGPDSADLTEKTQAIFVRATEAYRVLTDRTAGASAWISSPPRVAGLRSTRATKGGGAPRKNSECPTEGSGTVFAAGRDRQAPPRSRVSADEALREARRHLKATQAPQSQPRPRVSVDEALREARLRLKNDDAEGAVSLLHGIVAGTDGAEGRRVRRLLARAYVQEPKWRRYAVGQLRGLIEESPEDSEALCLLGELYRREGLCSRAEATLKRALALDPDDAEARSILGALEKERQASAGSKGSRIQRRPPFVARLFHTQSQKRPS